MLDFLWDSHNIIYTIALCVVFGLVIAETVGMLIGSSLMNLLDNIISVDTDLDIDPHAEVDAKSPFLRWLCLDRLPLLVWIVLLFSSFGIAGYITNFLMVKLVQFYLPMFGSLIIAVIASLFCTHYGGSFIARLFPKSQSSAVSPDGFSGKIATITIGVAKKGSPAEAALKDEFNQKHYVMVEPCDEAEKLAQGTQVVLVSRQGTCWQAIKFD